MLLHLHHPMTHLLDASLHRVELPLPAAQGILEVVLFFAEGVHNGFVDGAGCLVHELLVPIDDDGCGFFLRGVDCSI